MDKNSNKSWSFLIGLMLLLTTFAVFYQVHSFKFISFDDPYYVFQNPNIQAGITLKTIKWAFTAGYAANWYPLTWFSHMLDWQLFGPNAGGHHLTNLFFHIANTLLLFVVLKQMTDALWPSAFVAALFALHPLHVESVAWVSERKDVLSTFFWMLTMWAYVRFVNRPKITSYLLIVVFLALGLMSKPMLVTLPFVLLLLDYWPLDRMGLKLKKTDTKCSLFHLLVEKIPLFVEVFASCIVTFIVQKKGGAMTAGEKYSFFIRLANASVSYLQYIIKMIWPAGLTVFYPHPGPNISIPYAVISAVLLLTVTILILRFAANRRYLVTGWFWYLGTLVPVIGLVQIGEQAYADRYSYITLVGLFIIIAWGLSELTSRWRYKKILLASSALLIVSAMAVCTYLQLGYWQNRQVLFQHALDVTRDNYIAHFSIAASLYEQRKLDEAIYHYSEAIRIKPRYSRAFNGLGFTLYKTGRIDDAIYYYEKALQISPQYVEAHFNLSTVLITKGRRAEACKHLEEAIRLDPRRVEPMNYLAWLLAASREITIRSPEKAVRLARQACELADYKKPDVLDTLAVSYAAAGAFGKAIETEERALELCRSGKYKPLEEEIKKRLLLFKAGKAYIED
jgi:protein O-mannosyl-transferase